MEPEFSGTVVAEASISPSEDPEKVRQAVANLFPGVTGMAESGTDSVRFVCGDIRSLKHVREQLRDRHVRGAARRALLTARQGDSTSLMLNRQAAAVGVVAVCSGPDESPLGPVYVTVRSDEIGDVIDWLTAYETG